MTKVLRLPKALNSSGRVFHRVGVTAKNTLSPVIFLVLLGRSSSKCLIAGYNLTMAIDEYMMEHYYVLL